MGVVRLCQDDRRVDHRRAFEDDPIIEARLVRSLEPDAPPIVADLLTEVLQARRSQRAMSILVLRFGQIKGDAAEASVAMTKVLHQLSLSLRRLDRCGAINDEEALVTLRSCELPGARRAALRLLSDFHTRRIRSPGDTFEFYPAELLEEDESIPGMIERARAGAVVAARTVLIIDDDASVRDVWSDALDESGFRVCVARSGEEGVKIAAKEQIDLIITDLVMPGMDGVETMRRIRAVNEAAKFLLVSGVGDRLAGAAGVANSCGAEMTMTKPVDINLLSSAVKQLAKA